MIFVDTGAWIALTDTSDQYHDEAAQIYATLKQQRIRFITTDYVIDEAVTRLRYDANHRVALEFLDAMTLSGTAGALQIVHINESLFKDAVSIFRKYDSAVLSFTDCVSFAVCKNYEIPEAFAFDRHFAMMGVSLRSK